MTPLYLSASFGLSFDAPSQASGGDAYISDPAKPVPFMPRPVLDPFGDLTPGALGTSYDPWSKWLVQDQRFVDGRTDVLVYETPELTQAVHVQGIPIADIRAMTSGTDGDFVVKLIDVYPDKDPLNPADQRLSAAGRQWTSFVAAIVTASSIRARFRPTSRSSTGSSCPT